MIKNKYELNIYDYGIKQDRKEDIRTKNIFLSYYGLQNFKCKVIILYMSRVHPSLFEILKTV